MSTIQFTEVDLSLLRAHYLDEFHRVTKKLEEVNAILVKLGIPQAPTTTKQATHTSETLIPKQGLKRGPKRKTSKSESTTTNPQASISTTTRTRRSKKQSWSKFAQETLQTSDTPMTAQEILKAGETIFAVNDQNRKKAMQLLQASLYQLSKNKGKIGSEKKPDSFVSYFIPKA